jgi:hypothetical protein
MKFWGVFFLGMAAFALPVHASVVLGFVGTESGVPITGEEDVVIYNVTGPSFGCSTSAGTPICTAVTFDNAIVTVNGIALNLGDIGPGVTETFAFPGGVFADGSISSLSFSATLSNTDLTDDLGDKYNVNSSFSLTAIPTDGSLPTIAAPLSITSLPEPSALPLLLGLCLVGATAVWRSHRSLS